MIRCRSILATTVLTLSVVFSLFPEPRAAAGSKGLFKESRPVAQFRAQSRSRSLRSRHVKIDFDLLGDERGFRRASRKGRQSLELNLFPDTSFTAILDKIEPHPKGYSWIGRVQGTEDSIVILTVTDNVMAGNVSVPGASYQIRHTAAGVHAIREVDPKAVRPDGEPLVVDLESGASEVGKPIGRDEGGKSDGFPIGPSSYPIATCHSPCRQGIRQFPRRDLEISSIFWLSTHLRPARRREAPLESRV